MTENFVVLQSFPVPRPTTNPYLVLLARNLGGLAGVTVRTFSWREALTGDYDVFHVHWPEILVAGHSPLKALVRQGLTALLLLRLRLSGTPIVRTQHNLALPDGISRRERWLLRRFDRQTALWIRLNPETPVLDDRRQVLIPHGHYRDWFEPYPRPDPVDGRVVSFGFIRRYKGMHTLVEAFRGVPGEASLEIAGLPSTPELAADLEERAAGDGRITLQLRFQSDRELVDLVSRASLVVLPYPEMHNSGGVLTALSLGRPVLVPANAVNERLHHEVGPDWVYQYQGELTAGALADTLAAVAESRSAGVIAPPRLGAREWDDAARAHHAAYLRAATSPRPALAMVVG